MTTKKMLLFGALGVGAFLLYTKYLKVPAAAAPK
jgi:hypothetical protein